MPINHAIWKVGEKPQPLPVVRLPSEKTLEDMIEAAPAILSKEWMLIGRQERTPFGGIVDLLALAPDASLVLIELKRDKTPRDIVAQALDYASWVEGLTSDKISQIYARFSEGKTLDEAFASRFGNPLDEDELNNSHQIVIVAAELDDSTERILKYLNDRDIPINAIFFQVFEHGTDQLLSRAWLIDPGETQANVATTTKGKRESEPWNGEFYVSFGSDTTWDDARKYGFISAGGGTWYTQTMKMLSPGDRIWVKIPKTGFVGVGIVSDTVQSTNDFMVETASGPQPAVEALSTAARLREKADDPDMCEYFVGVNWLETVPEHEAFNEIGLFGNQNTVCKPTTPLWRHTVERLKTRFKNWDQA